FGLNLQEVVQTLSALEPHLRNLSLSLQQESRMENSSGERDRTQQLATQIAPNLQQLGILLLFLSHNLSSLSLGSQSSSAQLNSTNSQQRFIITPSSGVVASILSGETSST